MNHIGIDLSKKYYDVTLLPEGGEQSHAKFDNNINGHKQLVKWLKEQGIHQGHICMEATNVYWEGVAHYLYEKSYLVSVVNPARIKGHAMSQMQRNKDDKVDSYVNADFCRVHHPRLWSPPSAQERTMRNLIRQRADFLEIETQEKNRLADCQDEANKNRLKRHIAYLNQEIEALEGEIRRHVAAHPTLKANYELLRSVKGLGEIVSWTILAEMPDMAEYEDAAAAAADAGVTPSHHESGDTVRRKPKMSKIGKSAIRGVLYLPALAAMRFNPLLKSFADRLTKKGKPKKVVIVAVMRKLIHLAYGVLKNKTPFDPNFGSETAPAT
jgi:transposase